MSKPTHMDISNFPTGYYNPCQMDRWNVVCVVYDTTSSKSSLWVNHGKNIRSSSFSFPVTNVELEYMFGTLGFLWLHRDSLPYLLYLLEKLVDGLSKERTRPPPLQSITTTTIYEITIDINQSFNMEPRMCAMESSKVNTSRCMEMQLL